LGNFLLSVCVELAATLTVALVESVRRHPDTPRIDLRRPVVKKV
jgi:hypothetical protein